MSSDNKDSSNKDDVAIAAEIRAIGIQNRVLRARMSGLISEVEKSMVLAGVPDIRIAYSEDVDEVLKVLMRQAKSDSGKTDLLRMAHLALAVAWRAAVSADRAASILLDPASKIDPDDIFYI